MRARLDRHARRENDQPPEREGSADALVERADPNAYPLGFCPPRHPYEPPTEDE